MWQRLSALLMLCLRLSIATLCTGFVAFYLLRTYMPAPSSTLLSRHADQAQTDAYLQSIGQQQSTLQAYVSLLTNYAKGDFGRSWVNEQSIASLLPHRFFQSVGLMLPGALLAHLLAMILALSGWRMAGWIAALSSTAGLLLCTLFVQWLLCSPQALGWFPVFGLDGQNMSRYIYSVFAPSMALALAIYGSMLPYYRAVLADPERQYVMLQSRALGMPKWRVMIAGTRVVAAPLLARLLQDLPVQMLAGSFVVELSFAVTGMGATGFSAAVANDAPLLTAIALLSAGLMGVSFLLSGLAMQTLDPRLRSRAEA